MKKYKAFYIPGAILLGSLIISGAILTLGGGQGLAQRNDSNPSLGAVVNGDKVEFTIGENDHISGNVNAKITLIEFSDLVIPAQLIKEIIFFSFLRFLIFFSIFLGLDKSQTIYLIFLFLLFLSIFITLYFFLFKNFAISWPMPDEPPVIITVELFFLKIILNSVS